MHAGRYEVAFVSKRKVWKCNDACFGEFALRSILEVGIQMFQVNQNEIIDGTEPSLNITVSSVTKNRSQEISATRVQEAMRFHCSIQNPAIPAGLELSPCVSWL